MADKFYEEWCKQNYGDNPPTQEQIARDYWMMVETNSKKAFVEYGNDIDTKFFGSGFLDNDVDDSKGVKLMIVLTCFQRIITNEQVGILIICQYVMVLF